MTAPVRRWLKFNLVGVAGSAVQLSALAILKTGIGLHYLLATAIAVEAAVLHNFVWHERWTWVERTKTTTRELLGRFVRFHLANGFVSIFGNLVLMWCLVSKIGLGYYLANLLAVVACSVVNFWTSNRFVFRVKSLSCESPYSNAMMGVVIVSLALSMPALYEDRFADSLIRSAMESTYMLHLSEARSAAHELQRRYPDHPAGFLIEAETYWWEAQEDQGNKNIENNYYHAQEVARKKAEVAIETARYYKPELLAYVASAYGSYARFQVTQKGAYFGALRAGLRAHEYAQQAYALDNNYYDVWVGLGAFNYFTGTLPAVIKPFAWLVGATGDKDLGVRQLQTAMDKARYSRTEARIVYYSALLSNKEYAYAFPVLEGLMATYPDNFVLYDWAGVWFQEQHRMSDGIDYFERMYEKQLKRSPLMAQYALLEKAVLQVHGGLKPAAAQTLRRVVAVPSFDALLSRKVAALWLRTAAAVPEAQAG